MSDSAEAAGFWLPSDFLDDFLVDNEDLHKNNEAKSDPDFCFPTEFPYDFGTKSDQLLEFSQKRWVMSTSPQSTLSHMGSLNGRSSGGSSNGSPNGFPSPPTTPKNEAVEDLIYLAAGHVAKLKLRGSDFSGPTKHNSLVSPPRSGEQLYPATNAPNPSLIRNIYLQQQMVKQHKQGRDMWPQMYQMRMGQDSWPVQQNPTRTVGSGGRAMALGSGGGAAFKKGCAGTGVFLPRRYDNNSDRNAYASDSRKRPGYFASSIPNRNVHGLNRNFDDMNGFALSQPPSHPKLGGGFASEFDLLMARRNALILQHRRSLLLEGSSPMNRVAYLPQEWTY